MVTLWRSAPARIGATAAKKGEVRRGRFSRAKSILDASRRHIAEFDFETAVFGHAAPIQSGAAAAFRRFAASIG